MTSGLTTLPLSSPVDFSLEHKLEALRQIGEVTRRSRPSEADFWVAERTMVTDYKYIYLLLYDRTRNDEYSYELVACEAP